MRQMTHGDLFSGIGGFALAARGAGLKTLWSVEIDEFCTKVYAKHFEGVRQYGKIEDIESIQKVDVITGGFPCQPVSLAGRRKGQDDERWLWPETQRIISLVGPRWVLLENVPGLLGRGMSDVLGGLSEIGYDAEWQVIPASALGAPHIRERVWIVCYPGGKRGAGREVFSKDFVETLAYADGVSGNVGRKRKGRGKDHARHAQGAKGEGPVHDGQDAQPGLDFGTHGFSPEVDGGVTSEKIRSGKTLSKVRRTDGKNQIRKKPVGGHEGFSQSGLLRSSLHGSRVCQRHAILFGLVETRGEIPWEELRILWGYGGVGIAPHRWKLVERLQEKYPNLMHKLSFYSPPPCPACWEDGSWEDGIPRVLEGCPDRVDRLKSLGNAIVPQVAELILRRIVHESNQK